MPTSSSAYPVTLFAAQLPGMAAKAIELSMNGTSTQ